MAKAKNKRRADGLYSVQLTIGTNANGTPKRKTFYGHTVKEAEGKRTEYQENMRRGTLAANDKATFGDAAAVWLIYKRGQLGEKGIMQYRRYKSIVDHQLQPLMPRRIKELRPVDLDLILSEYAQAGKAKRTIKEFKQTASQIMDYAMGQDAVYRNVFAKVKIPAAHITEREAITDEQKRLLTTYWEGHRAGVGALIMLYCGLRKGELIPLTWKDIDLTNRTVSVNKSVMAIDGNTYAVKPGAKTKAGERLVNIPDCLIPALTRAKSAAGGFLVFPDAGGEMLTITGYKRLWESFMHYLNICAGGRDRSRSNPKIIAMEPFTAHQLRHTYATMLYDADVDPKSAQKALGHANVQQTLGIYTHLSQRKKASSIDKLNDFLKGESVAF